MKRYPYKKSDTLETKITIVVAASLAEMKVFCDNDIQEDAFERIAELLNQDLVEELVEKYVKKLYKN